MTKKKFWCHYIGKDGNTPKRRSIELTNLADFIPAIGDNEKCETPVWYEKVPDNEYKFVYSLYVQLSDNVALATMYNYFNSEQMELARKSYEQIEADQRKWLQNYYAEYPDLTDETRENLRLCSEEQIKFNKREHDKCVSRFKTCQNYTKLLLSGEWITRAAICAYEETGSPYLSELKELRCKADAQREEENKRRREEAIKEANEEARRRHDEYMAEQRRLTGEAVKCKEGKSISGKDVASLCIRYGIKVHLRTIHNLQVTVGDINGKEGTCHFYWKQGKRKPRLDGCFQAARELYDYLQTHDNLEAA